MKGSLRIQAKIYLPKNYFILFYIWNIETLSTQENSRTIQQLNKKDKGNIPRIKEEVS